VYALQASERLAETYAEIVDSGALYPPLRSQLTGTLPEETVSETDVTGDPEEGLDLLWIAAESPDPETAATVADAAPAALAELIEESGTVGDRVVTVRAARVPQDPSSPDLTLNLLVAGALGLVLNGLIAVGAEAIRGRLIAPDRAAESFGLPVLARVPSLSLVPLSARPGNGAGGVTPGAGRSRAPLATHSQESTP
jgi:capsular polysaccharide biosynthesis protein